MNTTGTEYHTQNCKYHFQRQGRDIMASSRELPVKNGRSFQITVSMGYGADGKQRTRRKTEHFPAGMTDKQIQKELKRKEVLFEEECKSGIYGGNITFAELSKRYFDEYIPTRAKETTRLRYMEIIGEINQGIGNIKIERLTVRHIQAFINDIRDNRKNKHTGGKLSSESIKYYHTVISSILGYAVKQQLIKDNPCRNVMLPKPDKKERQIYTIPETIKFLRLLDGEAPTKYRTFFYLAILGGFRNAELLGLKWQDIDFQKQTVNVLRTSNYSPDIGQYIDTPKTKKSERVLGLSEVVFQVLRQHRAEQNKLRFASGDRWINEDWVFTRDNGMVMGKSTPRQWLQKFCTAHDLPYYGVHSFRHLNATLLIANGADIKTVSFALGHSNATTTLNTYAHQFAEAQAKASDAIADALHLNNSDRKTGIS